ncbi:hypothetical protein [Halobacterium sp. CBA1126]|uniref:hypothetical protein n=1 Tax=Halobacterium sp. CBA1126 TaxID=2668074 RepID=UPI0012FA5D5F|nr:hypothetical protein [Halobacterium sp. CBA1126]MUV60621.1 hypothetical protein [Halobacterium sp. CBA1126]
MSQSERFQFGRFDLPSGEIPSVEEVYEAIDGEWQTRKEEEDETGETRVFQERGRTGYLSDTHSEYEFCSFYYGSDTENSIVVRDGDEEVEISQRELVLPRVLYFGNGMFAFESLEDLIKHWVPQFIAEKTDTSITPDDYFFYNTFSQDMMRDFYDRWDTVTVFKFGSPNGESAFEGDSPLATALNELAEDVSNQQFSGGQPGNNLKGADIVENAAENMQILKLHGSRDEELRQIILSSGTFQAAWSETDWPEDAGTGRRSEEIRQRLLPVLQRLD